MRKFYTYSPLLFQVFLRYPDALRPAFPRLKEKLEDPDPGVQSAAVNVICELARKNPKNYLSLAPIFFKLMTSSTNNWMLIKIIKLFGALTPLEPRLGKKLIEPLTNLIHSTSAMSLLYECINTVIGKYENYIVICIDREKVPKRDFGLPLTLKITIYYKVNKLQLNSRLYSVIYVIFGVITSRFDIYLEWNAKSYCSNSTLRTETENID